MLHSAECQDDNAVFSSRPHLHSPSGCATNATNRSWTAVEVVSLYRQLSLTTWLRKGLSSCDPLLRIGILESDALIQSHQACRDAVSTFYGPTHSHSTPTATAFYPLVTATSLQPQLLKHY